MRLGLRQHHRLRKPTLELIVPAPRRSAHTVRKGLATNLAESEATDSMLDGLFGWKDGKTSKIYTAKKQQAKLAKQAVLRID